MKRTTMMAAAVAALGAGFGVAALVSSAQDTADTAEAPPPVGPTTVVAPTATPTPEPPNPEARGAAHGDVLDVDPGGLPDGLTAYAMPDGTFVVVDPAEELPEPVSTALGDELAATVASTPDPRQLAVVMDELIAAASPGIGRTPVLVYPVQVPAGADSHAEESSWAYRAVDGYAVESGPPGPLSTVQAAAEQWILEHGRDRFTLVVAS